MATVLISAASSSQSFPVVTFGTGTGTDTGFTINSITPGLSQTYTGSGITYGNTGFVNVLPISGTITGTTVFQNGFEQFSISGLSVDAGSVGNAMASGNTEALRFLLLGADDIITGTSGNDAINSYGGNDIVNAGDGNNIVDGGSGNDSISSGSGDDFLIGGAGNDTMTGGAGNDTYQVDASGDVIVEAASSGTDTVQSFAGSYTLAANVENLSLLGSALNGTGNELANLITGNGGNNVLDGGAGVDSLQGGGGDDTLKGSDTDILAGGSGDDIYVTDGLQSVFEFLNDGIDTLRASVTIFLANYANVENIELSGILDIDATGDAGDNVLTGNSGLNILDGAGGNDTLVGVGADTLKGGTGNDIFVYDGQQTVVEDPGAGTDILRSSVTASLAGIANVENLELSGSGNVDGTGDDFDNVITGNSGVNLLSGAGGNDTLIGGAGDTLAGGLGNDTYQVTGSVTLIEAADAGVDSVASSAASFTLAANIENLALSAGGAVSATGNAQDNVISAANASARNFQGGDGNDTLIGGAGSDTLAGGMGDDFYIVTSTPNISGSENDIVVESEGGGTDTVKYDFSGLVFGPFSYLLGDNVENLILTGTGNVSATGNALANVLTGNDGNNFFSGGGGTDSFIGGLGNDTYTIDGDDTVTELANGGVDTIRTTFSYVLGANLENLALIVGAIDGTGNALSNHIEGSSDNNVIDGGASGDLMEGGAGNDTYYVDSANDSIVDESGTDLVYSSVSFILGTDFFLGNSRGVENLVLTGHAAINGTGNNFTNQLTGNDAANLLDGGFGADTMAGGAGDDTYFVSTLGDLVTENADEGVDTVNSAADFYSLTANVENLILTGSVVNGNGNGLANSITGNNANNNLGGGGGNDTLSGGLGNDDLDGQSGADTMTGGQGDDTYHVDDAGDVVIELPGEGNDTVQTALQVSGNYVLGANLENLILTGGANLNGTGNAQGNAITGNTGNNVLAGGDGDDTLDGGTGADTLVGGRGNDTYVVDNPGDAITDEVLQPFSIRLGSADGSGTAGNGASTSGALSADGRYLVFESLATGFAAGDVNSAHDVFLKDLDTGSIERISTPGFDGTSFLLNSRAASVSADGRFVAFWSDAQGLVEDDGNFETDVFVFDRQTQEMRLVSVTAGSTQGNNTSFEPALAADGQFVAFSSYATNLVASDTNFSQDVFVKNLTTGALERVSTGAGGTQANSHSFSPTISADGRYVAFLSGASNLVVASDANGGIADVYVKDRLTGEVQRASSSSAGVQALLASSDAAISADGTHVIFLSASTNLVAGDTNGHVDVFVKDLASGETVRASTDNDGDQGTGTILDAAISGNGRFVAFTSTATNLVSGVAGGSNQVYVKDLVTGQIALVSRNAAGDPGTGGDSAAPSFSADGTTISFHSSAANLVAGDANGVSDVLVAKNPFYVLGDGIDMVRASVDWTLGDGLENLVLTGFSLAGTGNALANHITGGAGNDTLDGGALGDRLEGGAGDDSYFVDSISDATIENPGAGTDQAFASATVTLGGNVENLTLTGIANLGGTGNALDNAITGNAGDNVLDGAAGSDILAGGAGDDIYILDVAGDSVVEGAGGGIDTVRASFSYVLGQDLENLTLIGSSAVNGTGNALANTITGNDGDNRLDGAGGADLLMGGRGNDTYIVDNAGDAVAGEGLQAFGIVRAFATQPGLTNVQWSNHGALSADGRYFAFQTLTTDGAQPFDYSSAAFIKDLWTGELRFVSASATGEMADGQTSALALSADGLRILFQSDAANLVPGDTNGVSDIFLKDLTTGAVQRVSTNGAGVEADAASVRADLSADGRYVIFESPATNLVAGATPAQTDVFLKDLQTGETRLVSADAAGSAGDIFSFNPVLSPDGRYAAFGSFAGNLAAGDANGEADIFVKDLQTGAVRLVPSGSVGGYNPDDFHFSFSGDGRYFAFSSMAADLVAGDVNGQADVFVLDLQTGAYRLVSADGLGGHAAGGMSIRPSISADGRYVAFESAADNLVPGDFNSALGATDVFVKDLDSGAIARVSVAANGAEADWYSRGAVISADGRFIAFESAASNLVPGDTNDRADSFIITNPLFVEGGGSDTVRSSVSWTLESNLENLVLTGSGNLGGTGNALNNVLTGNSGNNALDGAGGTDAAVYSGLYRQYGLSGNPATSATLTGPEGTDTLSSIEDLQFMDGTRHANGSWTIDATAGSVARLYWGTLDRAPDLGGLTFHVNAIKTGQVTLAQDAASFVGSAEFQAHYGALDNAQFVNQLYLNVLERPADAGGSAFWLNFLNTGGHTRGDVTLGFTDSVEYQTKLLPVIDQGVLAFNMLTGTSGDDVLTGSGLLDTLTGLGGNDTLSGGGGFDVAIFTGAFRQYGLTGSPATTATLGGPEGTDSLAGIEKLAFVDGSLYFNPDAHIAQVERLYQATLDRLPDALGQNFWQAILDSGAGQAGLNVMADSFVGSSEFQAHYGALDNAQFVNQLYLNVLDRPADAGGLAFWSGQLDGGMTRGQVVTGFSESAEFIQNNAALYAAGLWDIDETAASVARLYLGALGRAPDVEGLKFHTNAIKSGQFTLAQDAATFVASEEFQSTYGALNNGQFVNQLYLNVLNRPADPAGAAYWSGLLSGGYTRGDVALGFTESSEYQLQTIGQIDHGIAASDAHFP